MPKSTFLQASALSLAVTLATAPVAYAQRPKPRTTVPAAPAVKKGPEAAADYKAKADALKEQGKNDEAIAQYANAVEADPTFVPGLQEYGRSLYAKGRFPEAAVQFKKLLDVNPQEAVAWYNLAYSLRKTGDYAGAANAYSEYVKANPEDPDGYYGLAECLRAQGKKEEALAQYDVYATKETRPSEQAWVEKARAKMSMLRGDSQPSVPVTTVTSNNTAPVNETVTETRPPAPTAVAEVTPAPAPAAVTPPPAATAPTEVAAATPAPAPAPAPTPAPAPAVTTEVAPAPTPVATITSTPQPAAPPVASALRTRDPTAAIYKIREGDQMFGQKRFREALFAYQDAVKLDDQSVNGLLKMGLAYANLLYFKEAIEKWERVLQLDANNAYAKAYIEKAKPRLAAGAATPADQPKPVDGSAAAPVSPVAPAAPVVTPGAKASPEDEAAAKDAYRRAVALMGQNKYAEAITELNAAVAKNPNFVNAYVARGGAYLGMRSYNESVADYTKSLTLDPTLATPMYGLARAYERLGEKAKACDNYRKYATSTARDANAALKRSADTQADALCGQ